MVLLQTFVLRTYIFLQKDKSFWTLKSCQKRGVKELDQFPFLWTFARKLTNYGAGAKDWHGKLLTLNMFLKHEDWIFFLRQFFPSDSQLQSKSTQ